ncbi:hypothetical protein HHI36_021029 [Cryptolaemus montrouzieri]|uniref:Ionotropic glutamate receptor C-terminal domain-containing protein n=1 Tax=Cryptolaemus montrouzieri TaxID=559131 RepID=A0ABD2MVP5_9CUCU
MVARNDDLLKNGQTCSSYVMFINDVMNVNDVIGAQNKNKVIIVTKSSQWRVHEYLANRKSQKIVNLIVIAKSEMEVNADEQPPYVLYTHKLYIDAIASSTHVVLTSWRNGRFTRPHLDLFPRKMAEGFAGHRFTVALVDQPPFIVKSGADANENIIWEGMEVRIVELLSKTLNFSIDFKEADNANILGSSDSVLKMVSEKKANIGISGIFVSSEVISTVDTSNMYYQDCAAFMTLTSTALPKYRAIMGPFHWTVWVCLTLVYLLAIFPLSFSDKHTLKPLLQNPQEMENMFWYVFGTFTNAFSFSRKESWTNSDKMATRIFIGFYWVFTIIISASYTGSIIAFVTLPVYPPTIDSTSQLLNGRYQIGTLDKGGWVNRFSNSTDPVVEKLMAEVDLVPTIEEGIKNVTKAFFWPYAFLGSKANLDYYIRTKFVPTGKRSSLHVSQECLTTYGVAIVYPKKSEYAHILSASLDRIVQSGLVNKMRADTEWVTVRSSTGTYLAANRGGKNSLVVEDRALTLEDTQGMFLLLLLGYIVGGASLLSEWFGGCLNLCKPKRTRDDSSIPSNPRSYNGLSPRQRFEKMKYVSTMVMVNMHMLKNVHESVSGPERREAEDLDRKIDELFDFEDVFGDKTNEIEDAN